MSARFLIDTNVLAYRYDPADPLPRALVASAEAYGVDTVLTGDLSAGSAYGLVATLNPFEPSFDPGSLA